MTQSLDSIHREIIYKRLIFFSIIDDTTIHPNHKNSKILKKIAIKYFLEQLSLKN